jgi:hypothetical protein
MFLIHVRLGTDVVCWSLLSCLPPQNNLSGYTPQSYFGTVFHEIVNILISSRIIIFQFSATISDNLLA